MEFNVNEQGVRQLNQEMLGQMKQIAKLIGEIDSRHGTLRSALGSDYDAIAVSVRAMAGELNSAMNELNIIIRDTSEYMAEVHETRVSLY